MQNLEKTHLFKYQNEVNQLTKPLFDYSDIGFFCYSRYKRNGSALFLSSHPEYTQNCITQQKVITYNKLTSLLNHRDSKHSFDNHFFYLLEKDNIQAHSFAKNYDISSSMVMVDLKEDYYELLCFASSKSENIIQEYFINWEQLIRFKHYFIENSKNTIKKINNNDKIIIGNNDKINEELDEMAFEKEKLNEIFDPKHYQIFHDNKQVKIPRRELECLKYLVKGYNLKEVANLTGLSSSNVADNYLRRLQERLGFYSRSELKKFYLSSELIAL